MDREVNVPFDEEVLVVEYALIPNGSCRFGVA